MPGKKQIIQASLKIQKNEDVKIKLRIFVMIIMQKSCSPVDDALACESYWPGGGSQDSMIHNNTEGFVS